MIAVATMTRAVKAVTTYRGRDPRDFTICAFGGNGPIAGVEIARALQVPSVLIPPAPGVFSALGLLFGDTEREFVRTLMMRSAELDARPIGQAFITLEREAREQMRSEGHADDDVGLERFAEMRYAGQAYELPVRVAPSRIDIDDLIQSFVDEHVRTYGHGSPIDPVDLVSVRVLARVERSAGSSYDPLPSIVSQERESGSRATYFGEKHGAMETPVMTRAALIDGEKPGPLLIDEYDSTIVVPPGCSAQIDKYGNVEVKINGN